MAPPATQVHQIVRAALKLDASARRRFLDQQCGDDESMRARIEAIIGARPDEQPPPSYDEFDLDVVPEFPADHLPYQQIGPYEIIRLIARGGMGTIYEARERGLGRRVALKCVHGGAAAARPDVLKRFELESQTLAHLNHPSIVPIYTYGRTPDGAPYYAMEFVPGEPLDEYVRFRELSLNNRLHLFLQICDAVFHAHINGVIHRDLKPSNILVTEDQSSTAVRDSTRSKPLVKVVDFGLARVTNPAIGEQSALSETRAFLGTIRYMSPEQATGDSSRTDARSDVYSLGVILYQLLTERMPYDLEGALLPNALSMICSEPPKRPSLYEPKLRGDLETILLKALAKDKRMRYQSAAAFGEDIERYLHGVPILANPSSGASQLWRILARHRALTSTAALSLLTVVAVTAGFMVELNGERDHALLSQKMAIARANEAERERATAQEERDRARRLEDAYRVGTLLRQADELWPARPAILDSLDQWLHDARRLMERRGVHERTLERLRKRGVPLAHPDESRLGDLNRRLEQLRRSFDANADPVGRAQVRSELASVQGEFVALAARIAGERRYSFDDRDDQFSFETTLDLVKGLDVLADPTPHGNSIAGVQARHDFARTVRQLSIDDHRDAWELAIASIADPAECPAYGGLSIIEQVGLVPLGLNRDSGLWEFWHVQTGARPERDADGRLMITADTGMVFVLLPGGTFRPGAQREDAYGYNYDQQARPDEAPPAATFQIEPFFMSKYEMTQAQWLRFAGVNPSYLKPSASDADNVALTRPVEHVSWETARQTLSRLGLILPSESMWEYACRAGTTTPWSSGAEADSLARYALLANPSQAGQSLPGPGPVGALRPNEFGLHDMHGNVSEWCLDRYYDHIRPPASWAAEADLAGRDGAWRRYDARRITRGGSFFSDASEARSARRRAAARETQDDTIGVRAARWLEQ